VLADGLPVSQAATVQGLQPSETDEMDETFSRLGNVAEEFPRPAGITPNRTGRMHPQKDGV